MVESVFSLGFPDEWPEVPPERSGSPRDTVAEC